MHKYEELKKKFKTSEKIEKSVEKPYASKNLFER